jgi:MYXO-CTERM domain-containing protein
MVRVVVAVCVLAFAACAGTVHGVVFVDTNRDGIRQPKEPAVPGAVVTLERGLSMRTDAEGRFLFLAPDDGIVWVRVPDGFRPGSVWRRASDASADLPLVPLTTAEAASPLTFVVGADTHTPTGAGTWDGGDLDDVFAQALGLPAPPRFFTIVGDVTQGNQDIEFTRVEDALRAHRDVPWIPVPGNHDWYDGGAAWRRRWGPDNYSFDVGNLHVVVWDTNLPEQDQIDFFATDLSTVEPTLVVVALGHASPTDAIADQLAGLGVDYMFTGHWHANRRVERKNLVEWGTQTMIMGTIDQSPAGYRVVTFEGGVPTVEHRARLVEPQLAVTSPHPGSCTPPAGFQLLVSAALDATLPAVTARIDCGEERTLSPIGSGGWSFGVDIGPLTTGTHSIDLTATTPAGRKLTKQVAFEVCTPSTRTRTAADWLQLGGDATHTNATATAIQPPLTQLWATSIGGNIALGTPLVAGDTVIVGIRDMAAGDRGGLVALDLLTGVEKWRYATTFQVRSAPAIGGDLVVVALENGEVHAVSLVTGQRVWQHDAAAGLDSLAASLWSSPTIADGLVYVAIQGRMTALDLADGRLAWSRDRTPTYPWLGTLAAVSVAGGTAIANYARDEGMTGWSADGTRQWEMTGDKTIAINATPVISGTDLYFIDGAGFASAVSLPSRLQKWGRLLTPDTSDWNYSITATPAIANGRLFVPTQYTDLLALDAATGTELWRHATGAGPLNFAHYRAAQAGFAASPVVTGDVVWVPHPDGKLFALAAADGHELWSTDLGAPIVSAPAPAGDYLIVATYDGTVHALSPDWPVTPQAVQSCKPVDAADASPPDLVTASGSGCCSSSGDPATALLLLGVALLLARRRPVTW